MRAMKLKDVIAHTGIKNMPYEQAIKISHPGYGCREQSIALSLMTWRNTEQDWLRLQACLVILRRKARR